MTGDGGSPFILVHADESCLGNQLEGPQPGGAGALIETRDPDGTIQRWDWYAASPATTNNRMALHGAIAIAERLYRGTRRPRVLYCSDSRYLVDGITSWVAGWKRRGWRRRGGPVENVELWQALDRAVTGRPITFQWVRGHAGDPKNEYADHLAVRAAQSQTSSAGFRPSAFADWPARDPAFNPDDHFAQIEHDGLQGRRS